MQLLLRVSLSDLGQNRLQSFVIDTVPSGGGSIGARQVISHLSIGAPLDPLSAGQPVREWLARTNIEPITL